MAAQLTQRPFTFFPTTARTASPSSPASAAGRGAHKRRLLNIQAGLAELMLLNRLRARTRRDLAGDTLERAAQIIEVTSRHWFAEAVSLAQAEPDSFDEQTLRLAAETSKLTELQQR